MIREELLVKEKRMTAHSVEVLNKEMRMKVNRQQIPDGGQLKITINDEVREIQVYMNGLEVPVWKTDENCYVVYNVFGDLIVDAVLNEMIE